MKSSLAGFKGLAAAAAVLFSAALCGCGEPTVTQGDLARPTIPPGAQPVYTWSVPRATVHYPWHGLTQVDLTIHARSYFPSDYKDPEDARWEIQIATVATPDHPSEAGAYLGILRSYVDASGNRQHEIVPPLTVDALPDGIYGVIDNGVTFAPAAPAGTAPAAAGTGGVAAPAASKIETIRPVLHIRMVRDHKIDAWFDLPIELVPDHPSALTPLPAAASPEHQAHGTPLALPAAAPAAPAAGVTPTGPLGN
ncbi:MAG: hypothetical protein ACREJ2_15155 [Planctomycetota bacterium]